MIFLQPWILWFLLFLLVPIIVHWFNFQRPQKILFSNIQFVREIDKVVTQRLKFKQWLLLIARLLAVGSIVLSFAAPVIPVGDKSNFQTTTSNRSVIILIDNSYSMSASNAKGNYLEQAKNIAYELVKGYGISDEFQILTFGRHQYGGGFIRRAEALERIMQIGLLQNQFTHKQLIESIPLWFERSSSPVREVYVISDFQRSTFFAEVSKERLEGYQVHFIPVGGQPFKNVFIRSVEFEGGIIQKNRPVSLQVKIQNGSTEKVTDLSVQLKLNGRVVALQNVSLEGQEQRTLSLSFSIQESGWQRCELHMEDHPILFDNTRYFSFYVPERYKLLYVRGDKRSIYLEKFLNEVLEGFEVRTVEEREFSNLSLSNYQAMIMSGVEELSSGNVFKVKEWVAQGGGLLCFPSEHAREKGLNALYEALGVGKWEQMEYVKDGYELNSPDVEHPFFRDVFNPSGKNARMVSPIFKRVYRFKPSDHAKSLVVLNFKDKQPFWIQTQVQSGVVFTSMVFPDVSWSSWVLHSLFAPMVYKSLLVSANISRPLLYWELGQSDLYFLRTQSKELIKLKNGKREWVPEQYLQAGRVALQFSKLDISEGLYDLYQQDSLVSVIGFNVPIKESDFNYADKSMLEEYGKVWEGNPSVLLNTLDESRTGVPLWKYFVLLALLFLLAELLILKLVR